MEFSILKNSNLQTMLFLLQAANDSSQVVLRSPNKSALQTRQECYQLLDALTELQAAIDQQEKVFIER